MMPERFPTMEEVEKADREQIARWYQYLRKNQVEADNKILERIADRFMNMGGLTPGLITKLEVHAIDARVRSFS